MSEIKVTQTYNIEVNPEIYAFGKNFILSKDDKWFKLQLQKIQADSHSIKLLDDGFVNMCIKATIYFTIIDESDYNAAEFAGGKVSFTLDLNKVKISSLKGSFEVETSDIAEINLDLNSNLKPSQKDKDFFAREIFGIISRSDFKVNIEQTVSKIEYTEK